jgi:hypothetical protein
MSEVFKHTRTLLGILVLIGAFLHFYNLNWGAPYYFHPDERNVASSVSQIHFPIQNNPNFFAYGSLPIYTIYFTGVITNSIAHCWQAMGHCLPTDISFLSMFNTPTWGTLATVTFEQAIIISRFYSGLLATVLILLVYKLGKDIHSVHAGLLAAFLTTMSVGIIQFSHYGTFEIWLTFFGVLLTYVCVKFLQTEKPMYFFIATMLLGILIAIKVSSVVLLPMPLVAFSLSYLKEPGSRTFKRLFFTSLRTVALTIPMVFFIGLVYFATNPYVYFDLAAFQGSMKYESGVALGTLPVFYTQEFYQAAPIIFQFTRIYPFLINPLVTIVFIPSLLYIVLRTFLKKNYEYFILHISFFILFLSQAFLFVKWTRYMVPTVPFIYIIVAIASIDGITRMKLLALRQLCIALLLLTASIFAVAYVKTVLASPDTRIAAKQWFQQHFQQNVYALSEIYDMGIVPFNELPTTITLCDFYTIETNVIPCNGQPLQNLLEESMYLISPSQRIWKTRIVNKHTYPAGNGFYQSLFTEKIGYHKIYETPCDLWCKIVYLGNPTFSFEQTAYVFDRPTLMIFEKSAH